MTRQQLYDVILLELGMDTQDRRYDGRVVFQAVDSIRSAAIPDYVHIYGESALELFCVPVILPVQTDTVRNRKYIQLAFQLLGMKDRSGLIQVALAQDEEVVFIPVQLGMLSVYSGLEAGGAAGNYLYWLEGQRIYFKNLPAGISNILIKAIPNIYDLINDDDQVPMPTEFVAMIIQGVKERIAPQGVVPAEDKNNDERQGA